MLFSSTAIGINLKSQLQYFLISVYTDGSETPTPYGHAGADLSNCCS